MDGEVAAPDFVPASWSLPIWDGECDDCDSESVSILCVTEQGRIVMYDLWVECSWCRRDYQLEAPTEDCD